ncbi:MAG: hypothetical protein AB7E55_33215, partial [Pigmentiphaga sp.]
RLARKLEGLMKLPPLALDQPESTGVREESPRYGTEPEWPLSVPLEDFESLSPKARRELDEAFTKMVIGARTQELLNKQKKTGTNR